MEDGLGARGRLVRLGSSGICRDNLDVGRSIQDCIDRRLDLFYEVVRDLRDDRSGSSGPLVILVELPGSTLSASLPGLYDLDGTDGLLGSLDGVVAVSPLEGPPPGSPSCH